MEDMTLYTGGKYGEDFPEVLKAEEVAGVSGNDAPAQYEELIPYLQQIDYSVNQQGQILTVTISICAGLLVGIIFAIWFAKVWK